MNIKGIIKKALYRYLWLQDIICRNKVPYKVQRQNTFCYNSSFYIKDNAQVKIGKNSVLKGCSIKMLGNNSKLFIGENCSFIDTEFWLEDDNSSIIIGNATTISGRTQIAAIEGCKIIVGNDCMFADYISIRTGDSHSIFQDNVRINPSNDVLIGEHTWVGSHVAILKGVSISPNTVIGYGALVTKSYESENIIIAGHPARVIKTGMTWERQRI